jgi:hypothetical protein
MAAADREIGSYYLPGAWGADHPETVTCGSTIEHLSTASKAVISGHGVAIRESGVAVQLADGLLTAESVQGLPLRRREFALLVSCASGRYAHTLVSEVWGLPNALFHSGFDGVGVSMWAVDDRVAFVFTARILQLHSRSEHPMWAIVRQVRQWLRDLTVAEFRVWFYELRKCVELPHASVIAVGSWLAGRSPSERLMPSPHDWASMAYIGR